MSRFVLRTRADCPDLKKAAGAIEQAAWNALGFLNYTHAHYQYYSALLEEYADCQLCLVDTETGYPVAAANCVPVTVPDLDALPAEGWDWIVESAASPKSNPNMIGALAISVPQLHRSKGLARILIHAFRVLAAKRGYAGVVAPVRPSAKSKHPYIPIDDYVDWRDERGRAYDPWLRSHLAAGGKMVGVARKSMVVQEPIAFWETWAGRTFDESGEYEIDGALTPVNIDTAKGVGAYQEPNVWFAYAN